VVRWLGCWTCDQPVTESTVSRRAVGHRPWMNRSLTCATVTRQYNLVPVKKRLGIKPESLNQNPAESSGMATPRLWPWLPADWLPKTGISSGILRSHRVYGPQLSQYWNGSVVHARATVTRQFNLAPLLFTHLLIGRCRCAATRWMLSAGFVDGEDVKTS